MISAYELGKMAAEFEFVKDAVKSGLRMQRGKEMMRRDMAAAAAKGVDPRYAAAPIPPAQAAAEIGTKHGLPGAGAAAAPVAGAAADAAPGLLASLGIGSGKTWGPNFGSALLNRLKGMGTRHPLGLAALLGLGGLGAWNWYRTGNPLRHGEDMGALSDPSLSALKAQFREGPEAQFAGLDPASARWLQNAIQAQQLRSTAISSAMQDARNAFAPAPNRLFPGT